MPLPARYLQVTLDLPKDDHQTQMFEQYMRQLMPTFTDTPWPGWSLFLSATRDKTRDSAGGQDADDPNKQYFHIWRIQDYNSLPYIMERFDDDETYRHLDGMVLREDQDFAGALSFNPQSQHPSFAPPGGSRFYLRLAFDVKKDPILLSSYKDFMINCIHDDQSWPRQHGWTFVWGTYAQTSLLSRHCHVWSTHSSLPGPGDLVDWLKAQSDFAKALGGAPDWEIWEPVDYGAGS